MQHGVSLGLLSESVTCQQPGLWIRVASCRAGAPRPVCQRNAFSLGATRPGFFHAGAQRCASVRHLLPLLRLSTWWHCRGRSPLRLCHGGCASPAVSAATASAGIKMLRIDVFIEVSSETTVPITRLRLLTLCPGRVRQVPAVFGNIKKMTVCVGVGRSLHVSVRSRPAASDAAVAWHQWSRLGATADQGIDGARRAPESRIRGTHWRPVSIRPALQICHDAAHGLWRGESTMAARSWRDSGARIRMLCSSASLLLPRPA